MRGVPTIVGEMTASLKPFEFFLFYGLCELEVHETFANSVEDSITPRLKSSSTRSSL